MRTMNRSGKITLPVLASILCLLTISCGSSAKTSGAADNNVTRAEEGSYNEAQMGDEVFGQLKAERKIIEASSMYDSLGPVVDPIARTVQPRYEFPLRFYLVHDPTANAYTA